METSTAKYLRDNIKVISDFWFAESYSVLLMTDDTLFSIIQKSLIEP